MEYVSPLGNPAITDWRTGLPTAIRKADLDTFLKLQLTKVNWTFPEIRALSGKPWKDLYELRWRSDGVPHRIGGYFAEPRVFVMLIGFTHDARKYDPSETLTTSLKRRKQLQNGEASLNEYKIFTGEGAQEQELPSRVC
jgi:hypothetical protein